MCPPKTAGIFATQNRGQQSRVHSNRGVYSIPGLLPAGLPGGIPGARLPAAALRGALPGALPAWQVHAERRGRVVLGRAVFAVVVVVSRVLVRLFVRLLLLILVLVLVLVRVRTRQCLCRQIRRVVFVLDRAVFLLN